MKNTFISKGYLRNPKRLTARKSPWTDRPENTDMENWTDK